MGQSSHSNKTFTCKNCGKPFILPESTQTRYPDWTPSRCPACFDRTKPRGHSGPRARSLPLPDKRVKDADTAAPSTDEIDPLFSRSRPRTQAAPPDPAAPAPVMANSDELPRIQPIPSPTLRRALKEVLATLEAGPREGVFTDGACSGNPGPGGWAAVRVKDGELVARRFGRSPQTTNNRMELQALIAGYQLVGSDEALTLFSDSMLCVNTINTWAAAWERRGWRRKEGPVKNLDLVREAYRLARLHPRVELCWIKAHNGARWNEYVDILATAPL